MFTIVYDIDVYNRIEQTSMYVCSDQEIKYSTTLCCFVLFLFSAILAEHR